MHCHILNHLRNMCPLTSFVKHQATYHGSITQAVLGPLPLLSSEMSFKVRRVETQPTKENSERGETEEGHE